MRRKSITSLFRTGHSKQSTDRKILSEEEIRSLQEKTKLEEEQIVEKHESFLEEHPNGLIDKKSFDCLLSECFTKSSRKRIRSHLWRIYDLNLDGVVDSNVAGVAAAREHPTEDEITTKPNKAEK